MSFITRPSTGGSGNGSGSDVKIVDTLDSTSKVDGLSANKGNELKKKNEEVNTRIDNHESLLATDQEFGHVKPDNVTITVTNGVLTAIGGNSGDGSLSFKQEVVKATIDNQEEWDIPFSEFDSSKDFLVVSNNGSLLDTDSYSIVNNKVVAPLSYTPVPKDRNTMFFIMIKGSSSSGNIDVIDGSKLIDKSVGLNKLSQDVQDKINNAQVDSIDAEKVMTNPDKEFISSNQKSQITSNTGTLGSYGQRITSLEDQMNNGLESDGKVKMNQNSIPSYLEDMTDGMTIVNDSGVLKVLTLEGMSTTANEIDDALSGLIGNIQAQIDALNSLGNYTGTVRTYADLLLITNMNQKDMIIVMEDETQNEISSIYIYNGSQWVFSGQFKGGEIRDFTTNPIDLVTESKGILPKNRYEKQNAIETPFNSPNFSAINVLEAFEELFQYANNTKGKVASAVGYPVLKSDSADIMFTKIINLKDLLAQAITVQGVVSYSYDTLEEMAQKILAIPRITVEGVLKKKTKINVNAGSTIDVMLSDSITVGDVTATLIEFVKGAQNIIHYDLQFNNGDESNFEPNDNIVFDGSMKLKSRYEKSMTDTGNGNYSLVKNQDLKSLNGFKILSDDQTKIGYEWYYTNMTSNTAPSPLVASANSQQAGYEAYRAFNVGSTANDTWMTQSGITNGYIQLDMGNGHIFNSIKITSRNGLGYDTHSPKNFEIIASNDNSSFTNLGTFDNIVNWGNYEQRKFSFNNTISYRYYRLKINNNNGGVIIAINNILFGYEWR